MKSAGIRPALFLFGNPSVCLLFWFYPSPRQDRSSPLNRSIRSVFQRLVSRKEKLLREERVLISPCDVLVRPFPIVPERGHSRRLCPSPNRLPDAAFGQSAIF